MNPINILLGVILLDSGKDVSMKFDLYGEQVKATISPAIIFENNRYVSTDLDYREYHWFYIYNVSSWFDSLDDKKIFASFGALP